MAQNLVTVIIPVRNGHELFERALHSLAAQTYKDFNVVVSDDCSSPSLKPICTKFKQLNITYLLHKNSTIGANRQYALDYVFKHPTKYVMFLDGDDILMPNAIQVLVNTIETQKVELVRSDIIRSTDNVNAICNDETFVWLHGKIYSLDFLKKNNITFPESITTNEDVSFNLQAMGYLTQVYDIPDKLYIWYVNSNSITCKSDLPQKKCNSIDLIECVYYSYCKVKKIFPYLIEYIISLYEYYQKGLIFKLIEDRHKEQIKEMLNNKEVIKAIIVLINRNELKARCGLVEDDHAYFFQDSFGTWVMKFLDKDLLQETLKEIAEEKESKT